MLSNFPCALNSLLEILFLSFAKFVSMLDRLLEARNLGPDLVEAALNFVKSVIALCLPLTCIFDTGLELALPGDDFLEAILTLRKLPIRFVRQVIERRRAQREQFSNCAPFLSLVLAVAFGCSCLAVEMLDDIHQAVEVFLRVLNTVRRFPTTLLVLRDTGRFLEKHAHLFRLGLDQPRNHALLDNRIASRPEPRAQEYARDVLAPALGAIQKICRDTVTAHFSADRDLRVLGVLALERRLRIVEQQLDRGCTDRFPRARSVEDDVRNRVAAQPAGRAFAHHPAYRIDHVRLATAVRPDDTDKGARECDGCGVDEGFETGELDFA